jgi:hypothetical protein
MVGGTRRLGARGRCGTWRFRAAAGSRQPYGVRSRPWESPQRREPLTTNSTEVASARRGRGAVLGSTRISSGGRNQATALGEQRCSGIGERFDALGFLVELQKLCRMEDGFALVATHWNSPFDLRLAFMRSLKRLGMLDGLHQMPWSDAARSTGLSKNLPREMSRWAGRRSQRLPRGLG